MDERPDRIDWLLLGRYGLLVALCTLVPLPVVDRLVENALRRRLVRRIVGRHGIELPAQDVATLADAPSGGCAGLVWAVLAWPFKTLFKTVFLVFQVKGIADRFSEAVHRGLLLEEALERGWVRTGASEPVRRAMDRALAHVDTRPIERKLHGALRDARHELDRVIRETARIARLRGRAAPEALADAADADALGPDAERMSRAMTAAVRVSGLVPELVAWFRAEMGEVPRIEPGLPGPIEPELLPADPGAGPVEGALPVPVEDAVEVLPGARRGSG